MKFQQELEVSTIYLKPGEVCFSKSPVKIVTILGSCVSIVMYCRNQKIGAICHAVMPSHVDASMKSTKSLRDAFQYVDSSMEWMLHQFEKAGIKRNEIEVKLFGGSELLFDNKTGGIAVGKKNIESAIRIIKHKKLKLKAWNIGGNKGRKLVFYTDSGDVFTKFVSREMTAY